VSDALRATLYLGMGSTGLSDRRAEPEAVLSWSLEISGAAPDFFVAPGFSRRF
jgi:hypothetical protein